MTAKPLPYGKRSLTTAYKLGTAPAEIRRWIGNLVCLSERPALQWRVPYEEFVAECLLAVDTLSPLTLEGIRLGEDVRKVLQEQRGMFDIYWACLPQGPQAREAEECRRSNMQIWEDQWDLFIAVCKRRWSDRSEKLMTTQLCQFLGSDMFRGETKPDPLRDSVRAFCGRLRPPYHLFAQLGEVLFRVLYSAPYAGDQEGQQGVGVVELRQLLCEILDNRWLSTLDSALLVDEWKNELGGGLPYMERVRKRVQGLHLAILGQLNAHDESEEDKWISAMVACEFAETLGVPISLSRLSKLSRGDPAPFVSRKPSGSRLEIELKSFKRSISSERRAKCIELEDDNYAPWELPKQLRPFGSSGGLTVGDRPHSR